MTDRGYALYISTLARRLDAYLQTLVSTQLVPSFVSYPKFFLVVQLSETRRSIGQLLI